MPSRFDPSRPGAATQEPQSAERRLREGIAATVRDLSKIRPSGIVPYIFGFQNLGASAAATQLYRAFPGAAATFVQIGVMPLFRGQIIGLGLGANAAKTAGEATFEAYVAAEASGASMSWTTGKTHEVAAFNARDFGFRATDTLDVRVTTDAAFAPTTVDLELILYIAQTTTQALPV